MSHKTEWIDAGSDLYLGLGQRMLATDGGEFPLMNIREINLNTAEGPAEPTSEEEA
ncbi:type VI secretion system accessory protein TagJ [endosymbiont of Ridgeia piscesae]|uniref:type VI secretion system accessory protein TagJ n=1 Tax=endosymbiont of Ridgeia piscesae TaxID=54398 RepID=UPI0022773E39|nr:type VI secretion system accessory protein TagJ [endosymbiont of Ridgeia piscesae]